MSVPKKFPEVEREFGERVRHLRRANGMSQSALARAMVKLGWGFHQTIIARIEAGSRPLRLAEAIDLARILGIDLAAFADPTSQDAAVAVTVAAGRAQLAQIAVQTERIAVLVESLRGLTVLNADQVAS